MNDVAHASYEDRIVTAFTAFAVIWALVGMAAGVYVAAELVWPDLGFSQPWLSYGRLRTVHTNAVIFGFARMRVDRHVVLQRAAHVARTAVRAEARLVRLLRLAGARRARRSVPACRLDGWQGIRGARVAVRHCHCSALGQLRHRVLRHDREAHDAPDLHLELVLRRVDHRHRDAAHREQPGHSGHARARATRCSPVRRMPSCSGGTATTPSASC